MTLTAAPDERPTGTRLTLRTGDGAPVIAHRFDAASSRAVVLIAPALGVPQRFYFDFADWLAGQGFTALTFDYRGIGHGAPRSLRGLRASLDDWIRHDYAATLAEALRISDVKPLFVVGHSMGAQLLPLLPWSGAVRGMVAVAGGSGYWAGFPAWTRPFILLMVHGVAPLATPLAGYFPGRRLRMIGDLPAGVIRQWRRWVMHRDYLVGVEPGAREAYARARFDLLSLTFGDDRMMSERNVEALHSHFRHVRRETRRITPDEAGGPVGHLGFFRRRHCDTLWPIAADWLASRIDAQGDETRKGEARESQEPRAFGEGEASSTGSEGSRPTPVPPGGASR